MADQFIELNASLLALLSVQIEKTYDGTDVGLLMRSGNSVGAIPLISPTTGRPDLGLAVQPRFPWAGIGPMLGEMGWKITPTPLKLPLLRRSERRVPPWVLSSMILLRLQGILNSMQRRFEIVTEDRIAPKGRVDWPMYATNRIGKGQFLPVPCTYPVLSEDRLLKGAIRFTLERQLAALEGQRAAGPFVLQLLSIGQTLLRQVQDVAAHAPSAHVIGKWLSRPLLSEKFLDGIQAIEWTLEERGLAGLSDLDGIPWVMQMEQFYEAWVERVFAAVAIQVGGNLRVGRKRETVHPIVWDPSHATSQKALIPDIIFETGDRTIIVDAKYKRHWEEMQGRPWARCESEMREQHRADLFQILAYANFARTPQVIACLCYPCSAENWSDLKSRRRLIHRAEIASGLRSVELWLTAIPMATQVHAIVGPLVAAIQGQFNVPASPLEQN